MYQPVFFFFWPSYLPNGYAQISSYSQSFQCPNLRIRKSSFSSRQSSPFGSYIPPKSASASKHLWRGFKIWSSPAHPIDVGSWELGACYFGSAYLDTMSQSSFRRLDDHRSSRTLTLRVRDGKKVDFERVKETRELLIKHLNSTYCERGKQWREEQSGRLLPSMGMSKWLRGGVKRVGTGIFGQRAKKVQCNLISWQCTPSFWLPTCTY